MDHCQNSHQGNGGEFEWTAPETAYMNHSMKMSITVHLEHCLFAPHM